MLHCKILRNCPAAAQPSALIGPHLIYEQLSRQLSHKHASGNPRTAAAAKRDRRCALGTRQRGSSCIGSLCRHRFERNRSPDFLRASYRWQLRRSFRPAFTASTTMILSTDGMRTSRKTFAWGPSAGDLISRNEGEVSLRSDGSYGAGSGTAGFCARRD